MDVAELKRQVEYKFAPAPLLAVQALANTYDFDEGEERLLDAESTRRWLLASGLAADGVEVDEAARERLVAFRTLVRGLLEANLEADAEPDLDAFAAVAAEHPVRLAPTRRGELELDLTPVASVDELIAQQLGILFRSQVLGELRRLKICASDDCRWAFYDASKNRGGTWCRMEECGNRVKNRRYRERRAAREAA